MGIMKTRTRWRVVGGVCILACALLTFFGADAPAIRDSLLGFLAYWGVVFVLFIVALYTVLLDIRYTRVQYALAKRDVFLNTFGDKTFRKSLREAQRQKADEDKQE